MDKQLNLEDIQKEIGLITYAFKAGTGRSGDFLAKSKKAKKRLLEIEKVLREHLDLWQRNFSILRNEGSNIGSVNSAQIEFRKAQQNVSAKIDKIKKFFSDIGSALDYCRRIEEKAGNPAETTGTFGHDGVVEDTDVMSISKDKLQVTSQTIALLDTERYGTATGHETIIEYPKPDLGSPINQRNCSISDKIRIGLGTFSGRGRGNYRITMPEFYHNFSGGKV